MGADYVFNTRFQKTSQLHQAGIVRLLRETLRHNLRQYNIHLNSNLYK